MPQLLPDGLPTTWREVVGAPSPSSAQGFGGQPIGFAHIKGTRHEVRPGAVVDAHGPVGDRQFCFVDVDQARVLKTVQNPRLIQISTSLADGELTMVLPDGRVARGVSQGTGEWLTCDYWKRPVEVELTDGPHSDLASAWLGKPVRLARAPRGGVVFGSALSIVTTASLRALAERSGHSALLAEAARFRATLVLDTEEPFIEETWQGQEMTVGWGGLNGLWVRIGESIPRCAVIDLDPVTGARGGRLLKTLAATRACNAEGEPFFGVYAEVIDPASSPAR